MQDPRKLYFDGLYEYVITRSARIMIDLLKLAFTRENLLINDAPKLDASGSGHEAPRLAMTCQDLAIPPRSNSSHELFFFL